MTIPKDKMEELREKLSEEVAKSFRKMLEVPAATAVVLPMDPKDPTTFRMKLTVPLPYITMSLEVGEPENLQLSAEIAATKILELGEWRPYYAAALLLEMVKTLYGYQSITEIDESTFKNCLDDAVDSVRWCRRCLNWKMDPFVLYRDGTPGK